MSENYITELRLHRETNKAVQVSEKGAEKTFWLPKSQIGVYPTGGKDDDLVGVEMPRWLAEKEGLLR